MERHQIGPQSGRRPGLGEPEQEGGKGVVEVAKKANGLAKLFKVEDFFWKLDKTLRALWTTCWRQRRWGKAALHPEYCGKRPVSVPSSL